LLFARKLISELGIGTDLYTFRPEHNHTRYRVLLDGYLCHLAVNPEDTPTGYRWQRLEELTAYILTSFPPDIVVWLG